MEETRFRFLPARGIAMPRDDWDVIDCPECSYCDESAFNICKECDSEFCQDHASDIEGVCLSCSPIDIGDKF